MKESDILYQNGDLWVVKEKGMYFVMNDTGTHSESVGNCAWKDLSIAKAYCDYQAKRKAK